MISVVYSTFNESQNTFFIKSLEQFKQLQKKYPIEVICVDGGSSDDTLKIITSMGMHLMTSDAKARSERYNLGMKNAQHSMVLLHHPRSFLQPEGIIHLIENRLKLQWGAFTHQFDHTHPLLTFTSWYSNCVRGDLKNIFYLDHCLFAQKKLLQQINYFPPTEIFEDTEICLALKKFQTAKRLPFLSKTSSVRFKKNGVYNQILLNQKMKLDYYFGTNRKKMYQTYEQGIELNTQNLG